MKPYTCSGRTASEALIRVRSELGEDARVLAVRRTGGAASRVEISAVPSLSSVPSAAGTPVDLHENPVRWTEILEPTAADDFWEDPERVAVYGDLVGAGFDRSFAAVLIRRAGTMERSALRERIATLITDAVQHGHPLRKDGNGLLLVVGPAGVGKTTTTAKLAARMEMRRPGSVALVSADPYRLSGDGLLRDYAEAVGAPFRAATTPKELRDALIEVRVYPTVLVDTPGTARNEGRRRGELADLVNVCPGARALVLLDATRKAGDLRCDLEQLSFVLDRAGSCLGFTRLDETTRYGELLSEAARSRRPLALFSTGTRVPDDLSAVGPDEIRRLASRSLAPVVAAKAGSVQGSAQ